MATQLTGTGPQALAQDVMSESTVQLHNLGEKCFSNDGRTFRYVKAGAVALVPGNVIQSPAVVANHVNLTPTAVSAVGATTVTVTLGATAVVANFYSNGMLVVEKGTGKGLSYKIKSHPAADSSATLVVTLEDPIVVATAGTITVSLVANMYKGVIACPVTTLTGTPVGAAVFPIAINNFGWICSRGLTGVLADGIITQGTVGVAVPSGAAGAAKVMAATLFSIGTFSKTTIDTQITPCYLTLD